MPADHPVIISVYSDYVCPFCYLEEPVLDKLCPEQAIASKLNGVPLNSVLTPYP